MTPRQIRVAGSPFEQELVARVAHQVVRAATDRTRCPRAGASRRRAQRRGRPATIVALAAGAWAWSAAQGGPRNINPGDPVGRVQAVTIDGTKIDTDGWRGRPSVWVFVAAEQASSRAALTALQRVADGLPPPGAGMVALCGDAGKVAALREFASRERLRLPIVIDVDHAHYGRLGVIVLPTTLVVDSQGRLHAALPGYDLSYERTVDAHLRFLAGRIDAEELRQALAHGGTERNVGRDRAERLTRSAAVLAERGLRVEARKELEQAMAADPAYHRARLDLALLDLTEGDVAAAEERVNAVLAADANERLARLVMGVIRFQQNRLDEAEKLLRESLLLNPDPAVTNYWLGRVLSARGQTDQAAACFRAAAERMLPEYHHVLARPAEKPAHASRPAVR